MQSSDRGSWIHGSGQALKKQKARGVSVPGPSLVIVRLDFRHVLRLLSFRTIHDLKFNLLTLV
jgi:hypothetical protein